MLLPPWAWLWGGYFGGHFPHPPCATWSSWCCGRTTWLLCPIWQRDLHPHGHGRTWAMPSGDWGLGTSGGPFGVDLTAGSDVSVHTWGLPWTYWSSSSQCIPGGRGPLSSPPGLIVPLRATFAFALGPGRLFSLARYPWDGNIGTARLSVVKNALRTEDVGICGWLCVPSPLLVLSDDGIPKVLRALCWEGCCDYFDSSAFVGGKNDCWRQCHTFQCLVHMYIVRGAVFFRQVTDGQGDLWRGRPEGLGALPLAGIEGQCSSIPMRWECQGCQSPKAVPSFYKFGWKCCFGSFQQGYAHFRTAVHDGTKCRSILKPKIMLTRQWGSAWVGIQCSQIIAQPLWLPKRLKPLELCTPLVRPAPQELWRLAEFWPALSVRSFSPFVLQDSWWCRPDMRFFRLLPSCFFPGKLSLHVDPPRRTRDPCEVRARRAALPPRARPRLWTKEAAGLWKAKKKGRWDGNFSYVRPLHMYPNPRQMAHRQIDLLNSLV